ncbi:N-acetylglucosamine-6-phosphate deacetylase [Cohnella sp. JJ-181]|uniref:N-acetylglucosamine-6-phosphate deacetylase n=1 Tax=Cohnella rhizoplanae TaxID=2974897 RepID=UPI0022FF6A8A|nr:amidohydrolase family protein [Cohnella sp. JJ-181]CAI6080207.1 N-acetylglucosamine-6-phosphate deacetylase [Cohnella sp. JJ-181]
MILKALHYRTEEPVEIEIAAGRIARIAPAEADQAERNALPYAAPGLVDLQINGFAGHDFNRLPLPPELPGTVVRELWREGVTGCYPTVITNGPEAIASKLAAIAQSCEHDSAAAACIAGIHLEGPFISPEDGARGAHGRQYVRAPDWELFCRWQEAAGGRISILTLSPEWEGSAAFIRRCTDNGVTVSIGHTAATAEQIKEAVAAGARMSTHFGNGAHLMLPRHPNYLWEQLAQDELWSCLIADGFHLPDQVLQVVLKVKGPKAMLVSDAVYLSGMPPGEYETHIGGRVVLTPAGRLHLAEQEGLLAGSAQMLLWGIGQLADRGIASLADAWDMASVRPAGFMRLPAAAGLSVGAPADIVLFRRDDGKLRIDSTCKAGEIVFGDDGVVGER